MERDEEKVPRDPLAIAADIERCERILEEAKQNGDMEEMERLPHVLDKLEAEMRRADRR